MRRFEQVVEILKRSRELRALVADVDILVFGNDGSAERLMAEQVRKRGGEIYMVLDGLISPWRKGPITWFDRNRTRATVLKMLHSLLPTYVVPSFVGHSDLDKIFVMNEGVKAALETQGIKTPIQAVVLPRHEKLARAVRRKKHSEHRPPESEERLRILYATTAFRWHRLGFEAEMQDRDLHDLGLFAEQFQDRAEVRVRFHPRDLADCQSGFHQFSALQVHSTEIALEDDLAWADVIVATRSSIFYDAEIAAVEAVIYDRNVPSLPGYLAEWNMEYLPAISDFADLFARRDKNGGDVARRRNLPSLLDELPRILWLQPI